MDISALSTEALREELRLRQARQITSARQQREHSEDDFDDESLFLPEQLPRAIRRVTSESRKRRRSPSPGSFENDVTARPAHRTIKAKTGHTSTANAQEEEDYLLASRLQAEEDALLLRTNGQWTNTRTGSKTYPIDLDSTSPSFPAPYGFSHISDGDSDDHRTSALMDHISSDAAIARQLEREEILAQERRLRQAASRTRDCAVCGEATPIIELPSLASCSHPAQVCSECYASWIASQLEDNGWQEVKCPGTTCKINLTYEEIKAYASKELFERYDAFKARSALSSDPQFRWCRAERCVSGQIHGAGVGNVFVCIECGARYCTVHEGTYHADETCEEYEYRTSGQKERDERKKENEASEETLGKVSKKCPNETCGSPIQKNGGCNHITCWKCQHHFCYVCLGADWRRCGHLHADGI